MVAVKLDTNEKKKHQIQNHLKHFIFTLWLVDTIAPVQIIGAQTDSAKTIFGAVGGPINEHQPTEKKESTRILFFTLYQMIIKKMF